MLLRIGLALLLAVVLGLTACDRREEGYLEEAGREIDDVVQDAQGEKSTGDKVGEAVRDLGDEIEDKS